jgi:AraC-like DNA-binding protein
VYEIGQLEALYTYYENLFSEFRTRSEDFEYNSALQLRYIVYTIGQAKRERTVSRLDRSIRYIHTHLRYDLSVERLSEMEFLGVSRYRELFKDATGTSPQEYIARLRMERAKYLLSQTDMKIADVAEAVGYENRQYFQNVFRARVGITPGKFRKG